MLQKSKLTNIIQIRKLISFFKSAPKALATLQPLCIILRHFKLKRFKNSVHFKEKLQLCNIKRIQT